MTHRVVDAWDARALWVRAGEGVATRKWDGTACAFIDGVFYRRREVKAGAAMPDDFIPALEGFGTDPDLAIDATTDVPGWVPVLAIGSADALHREALVNSGTQPDGTYELIGPRVNGNPERATRHILVQHGIHPLTGAPRTFSELYDYLEAADIEGLVWHHPDGRMAKIKTKDFGLKRPCAPR